MYPTRLYLFWNTIPSLKIPSNYECNITEHDSYNWIGQNWLNANLTFKTLTMLRMLKVSFSLFADGCEAKHCWHSIDADSQDVAGSISLQFLAVKAVNICQLDVYNQSEHKLPKMGSSKSLTLRYCSFSEWGREQVAEWVDYWDYQHIVYIPQRPICCLITILTKPQMVDPLLTLISMNCVFNISCPR